MFSPKAHFALLLARGPGVKRFVQAQFAEVSFLVGHSFRLQNPDFQRIVRSSGVFLVGLDRFPQTEKYILNCYDWFWTKFRLILIIPCPPFFRNVNQNDRTQALNKCFTCLRIFSPKDAITTCVRFYISGILLKLLFCISPNATKFSSHFLASPIFDVVTQLIQRLTASFICSFDCYQNNFISLKPQKIFR